LKIKIGNLSLDTPVLPASGTFGYGDELVDIMDYKFIGAIITKTLTWNESEGNPPPRIWELENGLINNIGLQNIGVKRFCEEKLKRLIEIDKPLIVSIGGKHIDEIAKCVEFLTPITEISAFELNLSCPNIEMLKAISEDYELTFRTIEKIRRLTEKPLIAKLSPNVTDICEIGVAAEKAGADILCATNTFKGAFYDWDSGKIYKGGVSGRLIFPMTLRAVFELYRKVSIPIIGLGGIDSGRKALEMVFAGASAIGTGTLSVIYPNLPQKICEDILTFMKDTGKDFCSLVGLKNEK
ncbi:MAG: dihydroorotate dehydrogenase, partial [Candidatus Omnitrophica bacterium]|nr:dihydroorotate dehydrogenase [Candidatus Omnitrophota bacterium]